METIDALQRGSQMYGVPIDAINKTILEFLILVPEEVSNSDVIGPLK
jgi:hypothetical protein